MGFANGTVRVLVSKPSIAGWGPREGVTAWAFGAAGLGLQNGLATAVVYGVLVIVAIEARLLRLSSFISDGT